MTKEEVEVKCYRLQSQYSEKKKALFILTEVLPLFQTFLKSEEAKDNLLKSYKLMLDFYGIELCDEQTGEVKRASNWKDRFDNLNS